MSRRFAKAHPCPTATKTPFPDEESADEAIRYVGTFPPRELDGPMPRRSYRCACGAWHLTSSEIAYSDRLTAGAREGHSGS